MPPPSDRLGTGFPTLDRILRGGFAPGRVHVLVGPPGRGKTILLAQFGLRAAREHGAAVAGIFSDEGGWQAAMMMAEGVGFDRERLEDDFASIRELVAAAFSKWRIWLPDPGDHRTVVEAANIWFPELAPETPRLLLLDSAQTCRTIDGENAQSERERIDATMNAAKRIAERHRAAVVIAVKANRSSWANKKSDANTDPLAGALGSSSVEYTGDFHGFLEGDPEKTVRLVVCKNRLGNGTRPVIPLKFDRARATFAELAEDESKAEAEAAKANKEAVRAAEAREKVLRVLRRHSGGLATSQIAPLAHVRKADALKALEALEAGNEVRGVPRKKGAVVWEIVE
jgi:KaiC/GvpD/RAD55 family RecA-like ATPase